MSDADIDAAFLAITEHALEYFELVEAEALLTPEFRAWRDAILKRESE